MQNFNIVPLDKETFAGREFPFDYESDFFYEVSLVKTANGWHSDLIKTAFEKTFIKQETEKLLSHSINSASAYGILDGEKLLAALVLIESKWNNVLIVDHIWVEKGLRGSGAGSALMDRAKAIAKENGFRAVMLEVQSCNSRAIDFYLKQGFSLAGFNTHGYTNEDVLKKEVRFDMIYVL